MNKKPTADLFLQIDNLIELEAYEFRVRAENKAGVGEPCEPIGFIAADPFDPPGQPGIPDVTDMTPDSMKLTWEAPDDDGGSPITNYIVEKRIQGEVKWSVVNRNVPCPEETFTVTGLRPETLYEFRVTAENKAGQGPPSDPSKPFKYGESAYYQIHYILMAA